MIAVSLSAMCLDESLITQTNASFTFYVACTEGKVKIDEILSKQFSVEEG